MFGHVREHGLCDTHCTDSTTNPHPLVIYTEGVDDEEIVVNAAETLRKSEDTMFTQIFANNLYEWGLSLHQTGSTSQPHGYELTYDEYPKYYRWDKVNKVWLRRRRYSSRDTSAYIGRMRFVPPTTESMQTFYLRMLLHVTKGPRCFQDLKRVDGTLHDRYESACFSRGLIEDDVEWSVV